MGTDFFWFYDVMLAAILIGGMIAGAKKGFVRMLLGFSSVVIAFVLSLYVSDMVSTSIYTNVIEKPLSDSINNTLTETLGTGFSADLGKIDMSKATVNGKKLSELDLTGDPAGKIELNLDKLDLSQTGIKNVDLTAFGIEKNTDFKEMEIGKVQIFKSDLQTNSIGNMILAETLSDRIQTAPIFRSLNDIMKKIDETAPALGISADSLTQNDNTFITDVVLSLINSQGELGTALLDGVVKPVVMVPIRTLIFVILFAIIMLVLSIVIKKTTIINKIPLIGSMNSFLGGALGIVSGILSLFVVVIFIHLIIVMTDNTLVFLNDLTIDKTYAFKQVYNFNFLDFLS